MPAFVLHLALRPTSWCCFIVSTSSTVFLPFVPCSVWYELQNIYIAEYKIICSYVCVLSHFSHVQLFVTPWTAATPGLTNSRSLPKLMSIFSDITYFLHSFSLWLVYQLVSSHKIEISTGVSNRRNSVQELIAWMMEKLRSQRGRLRKAGDQ